MEENKKTEVEITPESQIDADETKDFKEINEDELRTKLAGEIGLDPELDSEMLDKLVDREKKHIIKQRQAIKQKIEWRERAISTPKPSVKEGQVDIDALLEVKLQERELARLGLPDELVAEIKELAQLKKITISDALSLPYIQNRKIEIENEKKVLNASPKRGGKGSSYVQPTVDVTKNLNPADYDFSTQEGVNTWNEHRKLRDEYILSKKK